MNIHFLLDLIASNKEGEIGNWRGHYLLAIHISVLIRDVLVQDRNLFLSKQTSIEGSIEQASNTIRAKKTENHRQEEFHIGSCF